MRPWFLSSLILLHGAGCAQHRLTVAHPMSQEALRVALSNEEPRYPELAARLDASDVPRLRTLAEGDDLALSTKAIYLASLLQSGNSHEIVSRAASSPVELNRIAAATALPNLPAATADRVAVQLMDDDNPAIAKLVLQAIARPSPELTEELRRLETRTPLPELRALVREKLQDH